MRPEHKKGCYKKEKGLNLIKESDQKDERGGVEEGEGGGRRAGRRNPSQAAVCKFQAENRWRKVFLLLHFPQHFSNSFFLPLYPKSAFPLMELAQLSLSFSIFLSLSLSPFFTTAGHR
jgi:hypothetical protein